MPGVIRDGRECVGGGFAMWGAICLSSCPGLGVGGQTSSRGGQGSPSLGKPHKGIQLPPGCVRASPMMNVQGIWGGPRVVNTFRPVIARWAGRHSCCSANAVSTSVCNEPCEL